MTHRIWIKNPLSILNEKAAGGLVIADGRIESCLAAGATPELSCDEVFDARQHVVVPGLVNGHHHFYQTLTRALPAALNQSLFSWLRALYPVWANLTPEMIQTSTQVALAELLLSGCTTAADHHYLFPEGVENATDLQVEAAQIFNMRTLFTRGSMSLGEDQGGLPPRTVVQQENVILADSERLIQNYHQQGEGAMVQIALAPCSPFSVTPELMQGSSELAQRYGVGLHTHLAETLDEEAFCERNFGVRTVAYLEQVGWLRKGTWLAHGIHFNDDEIAALGAAEVGVCHCPCSNMVLASGICRTCELEAAGCPIGLGVDGSASNDGSNMIAEVRQALMLQRLRYGADKVTHWDAWRWATEGGARMLGRTDVGRIEPGQQADLAFFTLDELRFAGSHDPLAALLLCGAQQADRVMVAGRWSVVAGKIPGLDLEALKRKQQRLAVQLAKSV